MKNNFYFRKTLTLLSFLFLASCLNIATVSAAEKNVKKKIKQKDLAKLELTPIAILPFTEKGDDVENSGSLASNLLFAKMLENGDYFMVEREKLENILNELKLNSSGLVASKSMVQVGNMVGAKILVTGTVFKVGKKTYLIAKIIGTETSRVIGVSQSGTDELEVLIDKLSTKVTKTVAKNYLKLLPKKNEVNIIEWLKVNKDKLKFKKIATSIIEKSNVKIDPAVETEIEKIFSEAGLEVVKNKDDADVVISGEAFSENAGMFGGFFTGAARIELKVIAKNKKILAVDRYTQIAPGVSWGVAQKNALQKGARNILTNILKVLVEKK